MDQSIVRELAEKVSGYFLAFLETDFKKQRAPRRKIQARTENDLLASIRLRRYPTLNQAVHDLILRPVKDGLEIKIAQSQYRSPLSSTLQNLIDQHVDAIPDNHFTHSAARTVELANRTIQDATKHPGQWVQSVVQGMMDAIDDEVARPLLTLLDGPLQEDARSFIDSALALESDVVALLSASATQALPQALNTLLVKKEVGPTRDVLADCLRPEDGRRLLKEFFRSFGTSDAYYDLHDLATYLKTGDNLQFYLYAGTLSFGHNTFPLFYIPGMLVPTKDRPEYTVVLDPHVYINKAAVDYVLQERSAATRHTGASPVGDRILYLGEDDSILSAVVTKMPKIVTAMELPMAVNISNSDHEKARTVEVAIDNDLLFAGFDKSDEAILNDYEELLVKLENSNEEVTTLFEDIVKGIIMDDPISVRGDVDAAMQREPLTAKLVVESPIPLNDEQREIRQALHHPKGRFIVVEGPPGTGKSHTITSLAFDAIMQNQSCLILSDKTEALDVVEDKLNTTLQAVRGDEEFQNPILRLGRQGANYRKLTSRASLTALRTHHAAQRTNRSRLDAELEAVKGWLSGEIEKTLSIYRKISLRDIATHMTTEQKLTETHGADFTRALAHMADTPDNITPFSKVVGMDAAGAVALVTTILGGTKYPTFDALTRDLKLADVAGNLRKSLKASVYGFQDPERALDYLKPLSDMGAIKCRDVLLRFTRLRRPLIGYLFRKQEIAALEQELFDAGLTRGPVDLRRDGADVKALVDFLLNLAENLDKHGLAAKNLEALQEWMRKRQKTDGLTDLRTILDAWGRIAKLEPALGAMRGRRPGEVVEGVLAGARHVYDRVKFVSAFSELPQLDYLSDKTKLERLYTSKMTDIVDGRFLSFADEQAAKMKTLAGVISARAKFPTDHFDALRNACPVIMASIREFAEYMQLKKDLFDLVVIDEGSQVSIAQALPAILRAKKVVVFGDSRQFSNVKSNNASIERNNVFKSDLHAFFKAKVANDAARLTRLSTFDVKASVLEFFGYCANFHVMLRKHFRSPQELIGFSSETFYGHQLQAIKVRGLPLEDTIRFDVVSPSEGGEPLRNVNKAEAAFILEKLQAMLQDEVPPTVGIITPFREQQVYLTRELTHVQEWPDFDSKLKLKIMTFDTCQGEEREVIFYSMVATKDRDVLNYVFPATVNLTPDDVEEKLKMQRLNVGFSRAQETVWFVLSKEISEYKGSISHVLNHYQHVLHDRQLGNAADTDPRSPMEPQVLAWLQATPFVQKHADDIDIQPGFNVGRYLQQLDPTYHHPLYKVDFLVTVEINDKVVKIIIEYDGFEFHFGDATGVNAGNYESYMSDADLHRQLVLEGYGYHFLRINRFNIGRDPVNTLSARLQQKVVGAVQDTLSESANHVIRTRQALQDGTQKECSGCHRAKPLKEFFDKNLRNGLGGYGRICQGCKGARRGTHGPWRRHRRW